MTASSTQLHHQLKIIPVLIDAEKRRESTTLVPYLFREIKEKKIAMMSWKFVTLDELIIESLKLT